MPSTDWTDRTYRKLTIWGTCEELDADLIQGLLATITHGYVALCEPGSQELSEAEIKSAHAKPALGAAIHMHMCGSPTVTTLNSPVVDDS